MGLGRGTGREDSWGGAGVGLAGSRWLWRELSGRPSRRAGPAGTRHGKARPRSRLRPQASGPRPTGGALLQPRADPQSTRGARDDAQRRFLRAARASLRCVSCPALSLSPSLSASSRGSERTGTGSGQFPGRGRTPGAVAMGTAEQHHWLEDKQAGFLTSDCHEDSPREPSWGRLGDAAWGEVGVGVKGLARGLAQGDTRKGEVKGHFFPKRLWGSASQEQPPVWGWVPSQPLCPLKPRSGGGGQVEGWLSTWCRGPGSQAALGTEPALQRPRGLQVGVKAARSEGQPSASTSAGLAASAPRPLGSQPWPQGCLISPGPQGVSWAGSRNAHTCGWG